MLCLASSCPARRPESPRPRPDVGLPGDDLPAERRHGLDRVREILLRAHAVADRLVVLEDVDGDNVRAPFGQPDRVTAALAAGGAGDEGDLACYSSCPGNYDVRRSAW
jgi:hypothetical protein